MIGEILKKPDVLARDYPQRSQVLETLTRIGQLTPAIQSQLLTLWQQNLETDKARLQAEIEDAFGTLRVSAASLSPALLKAVPAQAMLLQGKLHKARKENEQAIASFWPVLSDPSLNPESRYKALEELVDLLPPQNRIPPLEKMVAVMKQEMSPQQRANLGQESNQGRPLKQLYQWLADSYRQTGQLDKAEQYDYLLWDMED